MNRPVPLIRRFASISHHYQDHEVDLEQVWSLLGRSERTDWGQLRDQFRAVILADAGAGKTFELKAEAERMAAAGHAAFFIRIEDIDASFGAAFEVGTPEAFKNWLAGTEEAWFFLDSVDEVRLEAPRAFETAIRAFAARVHDARQRAHVFISSRPYAWRTNLDRALINELLPYDPPIAEQYDENDPKVISKADDEPNGLRLYRLSPLDHDDIRIFAGHRGVADADALIDALERTGLFNLAQLPFDLEDILAIWRETGSLDSRLAVLERGLARRLAPPAGVLGTLPLDRALEGARRLALAATLTGAANIRMPGTEGNGIDAAAVLFDWTVPDVRQLLGRGVFSDAIYSMTRFRHRETRELLAAQCVLDLLREAPRRAAIEAMLFQEVYGEQVVVPRTRPLLPWLILFDAPIRARALALQPEIATEGGDPARLPLDIRRAILRDIVATIAAGIGRGGDNSEVARIAQIDLVDETLALLAAHGDNDEVVFFLGRLVWQGAMAGAAQALAPIALNSDRGIYARIVSIRAIATIGGADACHKLWTSFNASGEILPRRLLAEIVDGAPPTLRSVELLLASLDAVEPHVQYETTGLAQAIHGLIDRLPIVNDRAPERPLVRLADGLACFLRREPYVERRECKVSEAFRWLMAPAMHTVERLIIGRSAAAIGPAALAILSQIPALRHWGGNEDREHKSKLSELVPRWTALNDALFWHSIAAARAARGPEDKPILDEWDVAWLGHFWSFDATSFARTLDWVTTRPDADDRVVALTRAFRTYVQNNRPRAWRRQLWRAVAGHPGLEAKLGMLMRPPASPERKAWRTSNRRWARRSQMRDDNQARSRAQFVARLRADPELVRAPAGLAPGQMTWSHLHLLRSIEGDGLRISRGAGANWTSLIPEFGVEVAEAFRDAALRQWRAYQPKVRSQDGGSNGIPYALTFAMAGLEIEAGEDSRGLSRLPADEARHAMLYALSELNGFPEWFEPLYRTCPETGFALIWGEIRWELRHCKPDEPMHYVMHDLIYHAPWLHAEMAVPVHNWLTEYGATNYDALRYGRTIMVSGGLASEKLAVLAQRRLVDPETPVDQRPSWFAFWIDCEPEAAIPALESELAALPTDADARFAESFVVALIGGRREGGPTIGRWKTPVHLKSLYVLMHRHIRSTEDINRRDGACYSPTARDDAQDARSHLFSLLVEMPGEETYREVLALADDHPDEEARIFMRRRAFERAVADSDRTWTTQDVLALSATKRDAA